MPRPPDDRETRVYLQRHLLPLNLLASLSFAGAIASMTRFGLSDPLPLCGFLAAAAFSLVYFALSTLATVPSRDFDIDRHHRLISSWRPTRPPSVDILLPICGEPLAVLANTWRFVAELDYAGPMRVYCLDDGGRDEARELAAAFGFVYLRRPDRGRFKKAGNLNHGLAYSSGEFLAIFDADFCPRPDFLRHLMPYFDAEAGLGIVQAPQYFTTNRAQNWLERGAGAVQEMFYRLIQPARQAKGGAICVGTNAVYRRRALVESGGFALVEHSEDVRTGFALRVHGWRLRYVAVVLATGLCPSDLPSFFSQQYRWCAGSMGLARSRAFWTAPLGWRTRVCFMAGFFYYLHTVLLLLIVPAIPLVALAFFAEQIRIANLALVAPALVYALVVLPIWHRSAYRLEVWSVMLVCSWAHLFAILDTIRGRTMQWQPTGARSRASGHYRIFRFGVALFGGATALAWVGLGVLRAATRHQVGVIPIIILGVFYAVNVGRIVTWRSAGRRQAGGTVAIATA